MKHMELNQELAKYGLTGKKAEVYLAILELGQATVHQIALKAGIKRTTAYDIVDQLILEGLAGQVKAGKRTLITAENPENLKNTLKYKLETLDRLLPELRSFYNLSLNKPKISVFEGKEGIIKLYYETLTNPKAQIQAFTAVTEGFAGLGAEGQEYINQRVKSGIPALVIAPETEEARRFAGRDTLEKRQTKLVAPDKYPFGVEINLWDQKVAIMSYTKAEMVGVLIESQQIYKTLKSIFDLCWDLLPAYLPAEALAQAGQAPAGPTPPPFDQVNVSQETQH